MDLPSAEDVNYWKTSQASADSWIDRITKMLDRHGGRVVSTIIGHKNDMAAIMFVFELDSSMFKIVWPILDTRDGEVNSLAARRQAATFIWHDVKARLMNRQVWGGRKAFLAYLLPEGSTNSLMEMSDQDITRLLPDLST